VPYVSLGRNSKSTRCVSDICSGAPLDTACTGSRRLPETSRLRFAERYRGWASPTFALVTHVFVLDPFWSQATIILSAMAIGANPYVIAQQYTVHVETVSSAVVVSTGMSVVTVSLLLIWLGVGEPPRP
jgi:predicted permease